MPLVTEMEELLVKNERNTWNEDEVYVALMLDPCVKAECFRGVEEKQSMIAVLKRFYGCYTRHIGVSNEEPIQGNNYKSENICFPAVLCHL